MLVRIILAILISLVCNLIGIYYQLISGIYVPLSIVLASIAAFIPLSRKAPSEEPHKHDWEMIYSKWKYIDYRLLYQRRVAFKCRGCGKMLGFTRQSPWSNANTLWYFLGMGWKFTPRDFKLGNGAYGRDWVAGKEIKNWVLKCIMGFLWFLLFVLFLIVFSILCCVFLLLLV